MAKLKEMQWLCQGCSFKCQATECECECHNLVYTAKSVRAWAGELAKQLEFVTVDLAGKPTEFEIERAIAKTARVRITLEDVAGGKT